MEVGLSSWRIVTRCDFDYRVIISVYSLNLRVDLYYNNYLMCKLYIGLLQKIPRRLKELLERYKIEVGPVIGRALEEEVKKKMIEELEFLVRGIKDEISGLSDEEMVMLIREDREGK